MFPLFPHPDSEYDKQIRRVLHELETTDPNSEQYGTLVERLQKLQKMRAEDRPDRPSSDTLVLAGANLIGLVLIIRHEQFNVITTKALGFVTRVR